MKDEELMEQYKECEAEAFEYLYQRYSSMVYGYLKRKLPTSEVEDTYQSVWRHLHEKKSHYSGQAFTPCFFHITKNLLTDQYRSMGRSRKHLDSFSEHRFKAQTCEILS